MLSIVLFFRFLLLLQVWYIL